VRQDDRRQSRARMYVFSHNHDFPRTGILESRRFSLPAGAWERAVVVRDQGCLGDGGRLGGTAAGRDGREFRATIPAP
jgi:hypothetical protein